MNSSCEPLKGFLMRACVALVLGLTLAFGSVALAQQPAAGRGRGAAPQEAPPPAPPAGSAGTYKSGADLMEILKKNMSPTGEMTTSAVSNTDQYRINIVHRSKPAGAIAHPGNTELHYIIEGSGTVVTGGTIKRPAAGSNGLATIENGVTKHVTKGDVVIVPENSAHWYKDIEGQITYLEVRWLAPVKK
jgi:mannose-6-phosphate isomerase-like protein (cupin superfamily)